jgi:hypothetical protein
MTKNHKSWLTLNRASTVLGKLAQDGWSKAQPIIFMVLDRCFFDGIRFTPPTLQFSTGKGSMDIPTLFWATFSSAAQTPRLVVEPD